MIRLHAKQIIMLHDELIKETGGLPGLRDRKLLESAVAAPFASWGGQNAYSSVEAQAARLAFGLVQNHPFNDGNKRIGILAMLSFLELNHIELSCADAELVALGLSMANGSMTDKEVLLWIIDHS
ncbi:MAG: type II toxin-antitoxin system death-on-curing family toxin [Desulfovibrio sp.]|jgi:death-on-curing protein|nr:type II toxin-antitoxin system death-on-curing family toxin [Desulfovibrio sp.]